MNHLFAFVSTVLNGAATGVLVAALVLASGRDASAAVVAHATYLGGASDEAAEWFGGTAAVALDAAGNAYVTGTTRSADFPTTPGADRTLDGPADVFVTKLSPAGAVLYSTYLGGPCEDWARDIAVDAAGNAYVTGRANAGVCWSTTGLGVLVAKLDPTGAVVWTTVLGGSLADTSIGRAIAVDAAGHAYVAGVASSASHDFPTTPGAVRETECPNVHMYAGDGFVAKLAPDGRSVVWSTFLCGSGDDAPNDVAVDAAGHAYVAGTTGSSDFPTVAPVQASPRGGPVSVAGFVSKLSPDGARLVWSTYLGGTGNNWLNAIAVDAHENAYVTGETDAEDFPTTAGVLQPESGSRHCLQRCTDAFVAKIDATGSALAYSTYLFGEYDESGYAVAVDGAGHAYVAGGTASLYFPVLDAFQPANRGLLDGFVAKLAPDGARLVWSTYLGGSRTGSSPRTGWDRAATIALDAAGRAWVGGYTQSYDLPTTVDAAQPGLGSDVCDVLGTPCGDVFVVRIDEAPAPAPPVRLDVAPRALAPGATLDATWAGIPAPGASDHLRLFELGSPGNAWDDRVVWWPTTGAAAGTLGLALPADLAEGWWELRLLVPDPAIGNLAGVVARSAPILVTATPQGPPGDPVCGDCDDGDPCTADECTPAGCASTPATGVAGVACACRRTIPAACAGETVPAAVAARRERACGLVDAATADPALARRHLRRAARALGAAIRAAARARKKALSRACAAALATDLRDARERAARTAHD